jgi:hypothetical protein
VAVCDQTDDRRRYFILLSSVDRKPLYEEFIQECPHDIELICEIESLREFCVSCPPLAVILDMTAVIQAGAKTMRPLFELRMHWPVLRCNIVPSGELTAICTDPSQSGPLAELLCDIEANREPWRTALETGRLRRYLRLEKNCRVEFRVDGSDRWVRGNILNVSFDGTFVVSYETLARGTKVELKLHDLLDEPCQLLAEVIWVRTWEESTEPPGIGLKFDLDTVRDDFNNAMLNSANLFG